jgi:hypothetical protein
MLIFIKSFMFVAYYNDLHLLFAIFIIWNPSQMRLLMLAILPRYWGACLVDEVYRSWRLLCLADLEEVTAALTNWPTDYLHRAESLLRSQQLFSLSRNSQSFKETESSLPCPQEPATDPCLSKNVGKNRNHTVLHPRRRYSARWI